MAALAAVRGRRRSRVLDLAVGCRLSGVSPFSLWHSRHFSVPTYPPACAATRTCALAGGCGAAGVCAGAGGVAARRWRGGWRRRSCLRSERNRAGADGDGRGENTGRKQTVAVIHHGSPGADSRTRADKSRGPDARGQGHPEGRGYFPESTARAADGCGRGRHSKSCDHTQCAPRSATPTAVAPMPSLRMPGEAPEYRSTDRDSGPPGSWLAA